MEKLNPTIQDMLDLLDAVEQGKVKLTAKEQELMDSLIDDMDRVLEKKRESGEL